MILIILLSWVACQKKITKADVLSINGYWEIEKVVFPSSKEKKYAVNEVIDYFMIDTTFTGSRKKMIPQLNGELLTNNVIEKIEIVEKNTIFYIIYTTQYATWQEEIITISQESLVLKNAEGCSYFYKKKNFINE